MKVTNIFRKIENIRGIIVFFLIGVLFTGISIMVISKPSVELVSAEGEIKKIESYVDDFDETQYRVIVDYTDKEGVLHVNLEYPSYSSSMKIGDKVEVKYDPLSPDKLQAAGSEFIPYIILVLGIFAIIFAMLKLIKSFKKKDYNTPFEDSKEIEVDKSVVEKIKNDNSKANDYYFHWTGKMNQSYIMETTDRVPIYEAICNKITALKPYEYTFVDHKTGKRTDHLITHTITSRDGHSISENTTFSVVASSDFKIDNVNNWEYLSNLGYNIEPNREGLKLNFDVMHHGVCVAHLESAGKNILDGKTSKLGNIPTPGLYKVSCKESDIEAVFFACFCVSRVEFY